MALDSVKNFALGIVSTGYDEAVTSIVLTTGHGQLFPAPATDGAFNAVWWNSTDYTDPAKQHLAFLLGTETEDIEIVRVTARTTDTFSTIVRGQEGTAAEQHNKVGKEYSIMLALTTKMIADIVTELDAKVLKSTYDANSILIATSDNTPIALVIGASTIVGRKSTGDIVALTAAELRAIINVADGATAGVAPLNVLFSETVAAGDEINLYTNAGTINARKANATDNTKPSHGFVKAAVNSASNGDVYPLIGINSNKSGLTVGSDYVLSTTGGGILISSSAPATAGNIVQLLGRAITATSLLYNPGDIYEVS